MFKKTSILISLIGLLLNKHMVECNAIPEPASNDPIQSIPTGGMPFGGNNVVSQFSPSQNPPTGFGPNVRPTFFGSSSQLMPFPVYFNSQQPPPPPPQPFGGQLGGPAYPYVSAYGGNNAGNPPQMLPYYGQFRPYQGGQAAGGIGASITPFSSRFQTNLQFGQQPPLFDRMDTAKQTDDQDKKQPTQQ